MEMQRRCRGLSRVLAVLVLCWLSWSLACPPECLRKCLDTEEGCSGSSVSCTCTGLGWIAIPPLDNQSVILSFTLTGSNLSHIGGHTFAAMPDLEVLVLTNNSIRSLEPRAFHGLNGLLILNLSGNSLSRIDSRELEPLKSLEKLDLSGNSISHVASGAFQGLKRLQALDLSRNNISQLHSSMFLGLGGLSSLLLGYNSIRFVSANTFQSLQRLQDLSLSHNAISDYDPWALNGTVGMVSLVLSHNFLNSLPAMFTLAMPTLQNLDLAGNLIVSLNQSQFAPGKQLRTLDLSEMHHLVAVPPKAFAELPMLESVNMSNCPRLTYVNSEAFRDCVSLRVLDLRSSGLQALRPGLLSSLPGLKRLYLDHNHWWCNCSAHWLAAVKETRPELFGSAPEVRCARPRSTEGRSVFDFHNYSDNCTNATVTFFAPLVSFRIDSTALLECKVEGDPAPDIVWSTPKNGAFHWQSEDKELALVQPTDKTLSDIIPKERASRVRVLKNGNLFISNVKIEDAGLYTCMADNSLGNNSATMRMILDYEILVQVKVVSILVGLATSVAFLLTMLVGQLVHMILNRWGWCCCRGKLPPKARRVRKMLESIEHYKKQQLDRLRDNYNMQVQRIKDNGTQQMEWLRESYYSQTDKLRDIRDYGTLQIDRMRDQYYDQVRRVRDYSVQQMSRVRENYVSQRNRIRKFSAHQLFKLRESYKVQQMHLNKILENLNLESCRTVCARTDSVMFTSEITMDPSFVQGRVLKPIRLDGSPGSEDSSDFGMMDSVEMGRLMMPLELEEYELRPLNRHGAHVADERDMPPLTLPVLLLHQDLPKVHESGDNAAESSRSGIAVSQSHRSGDRCSGRHRVLDSIRSGELVAEGLRNAKDHRSGKRAPESQRSGDRVEEIQQRDSCPEGGSLSEDTSLDEVWVVTSTPSPGSTPQAASRIDDNAVAV